MSTRPEPEATAGRLRLVLAELGRRLRKDCPGDLTPSRLSALSIIAGCQPVPIGELARRMAVSGPTASHIVDALVVQGLITRRPDQRDRRVCHLETSPAGRELLAEMGRHSTGYLADRIHRLPPDEQTALAAALPALEALAAAPTNNGGMIR